MSIQSHPTDHIFFPDFLQEPSEGNLKLENRHSSPPPKEWNDMVAKIAKEKEVKP